VAIHGTHRVRVLHNVAFNVMGHTFFVEDGGETENVFEGNLGIWTRKSHSLLNTDTTPATFWITNPDNVVVGNVAAGSEAYGFWYRMRAHPEGSSFTTSVCPLHTPLRRFAFNTAHSNLRYGLRVFEEYFPSTDPCAPSRGVAVPAVFEGLVAYKNGMKGAIATQVRVSPISSCTRDCLSVYLSIRLSFCLAVSMSVCIYVRPSVCLSARLSVQRLGVWVSRRCFVHRRWERWCSKTSRWWTTARAPPPPPPR
jgi:hypothetical protein